MENLRERISYLKGLAEGMGIGESSNEGKVLKGIIEVLDEMTDSITEISDIQKETEEKIDYLDEDLASLEYEYYNEHEPMDEEDELKDEEYYEVECSNCHDLVIIDEEMLLSEEILKCPNCNAEIELEIDDCDCDDDCQCDCGCGCDCEEEEEN